MEKQMQWGKYSKPGKDTPNDYPLPNGKPRKHRHK